MSRPLNLSETTCMLKVKYLLKCFAGSGAKKNPVFSCPWIVNALFLAFRAAHFPVSGPVESEILIRLYESYSNYLVIWHLTFIAFRWLVNTINSDLLYVYFCKMFKVNTLTAFFVHLLLQRFDLNYNHCSLFSDFK